MRPNPEYVEYMIEKQRQLQQKNEEATPAFQKYLKDRREALKKVHSEVPPMKERKDAIR